MRLLASTTASHLVPTLHPDHHQSWMAPDLAKTRLVYVSDQGTGDVYIFSYRQAVLKGTITGLNSPYGMCSDSTGNVWITEFNGGDIKEYAHGVTVPIKTLTTGGNPIGCSVDPNTGNLAVSVYAGSGSTRGYVLVYPNASGTPTRYMNGKVRHFWSPGYDNGSNLFVETLTARTPFGLYELSAGGATLKKVSFSQTIHFAGGVQWDGKYLALDDQEYAHVGSEYFSGIYQVTVSNFKATLIGSTELTLSGSCTSTDVSQPWLPKLGSGRTNPQAMKVVGANSYCANAGFWNYPAGGTATKVITGFGYPVGETVSRGEPMT